MFDKLTYEEIKELHSKMARGFRNSMRQGIAVDNGNTRWALRSAIQWVGVASDISKIEADLMDELYR